MSVVSRLGGLLIPVVWRDGLKINAKLIQKEHEPLLIDMAQNIGRKQKNEDESITKATKMKCWLAQKNGIRIIPKRRASLQERASRSGGSQTLKNSVRVTDDIGLLIQKKYVRVLKRAMPKELQPNVAMGALSLLRNSSICAKRITGGVPIVAVR